MTRDSSGDAFVEFTTRPWFAYELEKSSDLITWEPAGVTAYGFGQTVRLLEFAFEVWLLGARLRGSERGRKGGDCMHGIILILPLSRGIELKSEELAEKPVLRFII